ncbi:Mitochondrial import inner membrane translocase subunit TIM10 [Canna indica]|uniref:Mitochondrial import inner membrane translocase subunit n=1 Tax=Canna indica TaxID=4628 RepID=A0AAQ3KXP7_9LILI|nr:Mitochondrial import inner membrane translocase subunit TIM10 [Canna indica]
MDRIPSSPSDPSEDSLPVADKTSSVDLRKEQNLVTIEKEVEFRVDLYNRVVKTCFDKCIEKRYKESELYIGENSCVDRCVSKYSQVNNIIGQILASQRESM